MQAGQGIEKKVRTRVRRQRMQEIVLASLYATTAVGVVVVAPNALRFLKHVNKFIVPSPKLHRRISQAITRLQQKGLARRVQSGKGTRLKLTDKGRGLAERLEATHVFTLRKPRRWDGKWRIVIFDVWERRRTIRDRLRIMLQKAGFIKIQDSVWVYPYDCEELFVFLRTDLQLGKGILYIVAEEIEQDERLRHHFGLE